MRRNRMCVSGALGVAALAFAAPVQANEFVAAGQKGHDQRLVTFDGNDPGDTNRSYRIGGLVGRDRIDGLDRRPCTGELYALGRKGDSAQIYKVRLDGRKASATPQGTRFATRGRFFGFDFNPVVDRIRITSDVQNLRVSPGPAAAPCPNVMPAPPAGTVVMPEDGNPAYAAGDRNEGRDPHVVGSAYRNSGVGAPPAATELYVIDSRFDTLATQDPPNAGTLNTDGRLGVNTSVRVGFDIAKFGDGEERGYAALQPEGKRASSFYRIDLDSGYASRQGRIGGLDWVRGLTAISP